MFSFPDEQIHYYQEIAISSFEMTHAAIILQFYIDQKNQGETSQYNLQIIELQGDMIAP